MKSSAAFLAYPVVADVRNFDRQSGSLVERMIFNHRPVIVLFCLFVSVLLGQRAIQVEVNASYEKMIPVTHPYIANYLAHKDGLQGLGNTLRIAVEAGHGTIFDAGYLETLRRISDDVFLIPGVDRPYMKSLWMPSVRWVAVTEEGLDGGPVIPPEYDGSPASLAQVRANVERSGEIGRLAAANHRSSIIQVPLLSHDPATGRPLDYRQLSAALETVRAAYQPYGVTLHITGFAKAMGDLIDGLDALLGFFALSVLISAAALYGHTRCARSTAIVVCCSLVAVTCLLGLLQLLDRMLDPYSILVPFLVFAIGMSHGAQKMNGIMQDIGRGTHQLVAARYCFRRLFLPGLTALLADAAGFGVLMTIPIASIQDLALAASLGVALLIVTNLMLVPVLLSYTGVNAAAARKSIHPELSGTGLMLPAALTGRHGAVFVLVAAAMLGGAGLALGSQLKIGDLQSGAPELRPGSRYNRDNAFMTANYAASSDILVVMVKTAQFKCADHTVLMRTDALEWQLQQLPEVVATQSLAGLSKRFAVGMNEGNLKWYDLPRTQAMLHAIAARAPRELLNQDCDLLALYVYLRDHKADTLARTTAHIENFAAANNTQALRFLLAAGNAGIEAAANQVVKQAGRLMLVLVYAAVVLLCFITFRSWRAVLCVILPLMLTSILCEALMVLLGIGVKVGTLPVIALGIGIGVDYGLYVLAVLQAGLRTGMRLPQAYRATLDFTGRVVLLTGLTLALAVGTWIFSPIKFQADMGILLAFMFLWNLAGALLLLPALAFFLLQPRSGQACNARA